MKHERITAGSREEAWKKAQEIFGCSYDLDAERSERAGYNIYTGCSDVDCWISDLGSSLELNMSNGETILIGVEEPEKRYSASEIRQIVKNAKRELRSVERISEAIGRVEFTDVKGAVIELISARRRELKAKLEEFGFC